jgi:AraC-like DNA-binding protein
MCNPKNNILIVCNSDNRYIFKNYLLAYNCTYKESLSKVRDSLKHKNFDSLLLYCKINCTHEEEVILKYVAECFPNMNSIAIVKKSEVKLSHFLGMNSIKEVIHTDELDTLDSLIQKATRTNITLDKFGIVLNNYPPLLQKILRFIEDNYLTIFTITDIANYIGVVECTIDREFQKNNLCPPKRLLMYFKIMHSVELLKNSDLKIKEIANLSGFTNEQRFIECFVRVHNLSPSKYRKNTNLTDRNIVNQENVMNVK